MFTEPFFTVAAACCLLFSSVNAHMVIREPVPYGKTSLTNSPLEPDGSDFPCKQRSGVYDVTTMNNMPVGVPQNLAFTGGATHGGGSCQVSVTLDKEPTKNSEWKVIHSIIGGCPSNSSNNLSGNPDGINASVFQFSIPEGMPNGEYTLAWTWFNKIGNREMYMNCAPISVTGGAENNDVLDTLPDMFVANIGNGCGIAEGQDFVFPNCGKHAETVVQTALGSSTTGNCAAPTAGAGSGSPSAAGGHSTPASSPAVPTGYGAGASSGFGSGSGAFPTANGTSQAVAPTASSYGGNSSAAAGAPAPTGYGAGASTSDAGAAAGSIVTTYDIVTETAMVTITADGPAPSSYASPANSASPNSGRPVGYGRNKGKHTSGSGDTTSGSTKLENTTSSESVPCTTQDEIICMPDGKFGICNNGFASPMRLSKGTSCSGGQVSKRHNVSRHLRKHLKPYGHSV